MSTPRNFRRKTPKERPPRPPGNGPKHPPHLKGKEIGLFYARKNIMKRNQPLKPIPTVTISRELKKKINKILKTPNEPNVLSDIDEKTYNHIQDSTFKRSFLQTINESLVDKLARGSTAIQRNPDLDSSYYQQFKAKQDSSKYQEMLKFRSKLPSFAMKEEILHLISNNQIVVISGETGCGKTTQVAQFILDDYLEKHNGSLCRIVCTQPRRISAISVAERVAEERIEKLGDSIGYHIRLEHVLPRDRASILFCTTGIILKKMETDASLSSTTHLILDEIHERDVLSDFILALIKKIINQRKDLKIILMSATLNSEKFSKYYNNAPHVNIPGFTYPVQEFYLEDVLEMTKFQYEDIQQQKRHNAPKFDLDFLNIIDVHVRNLDGKYSKQVLKQLKNPQSEEINLGLILELIKHICCKNVADGAILVFLTGYAEISTLSTLMEKSGNFPTYQYRIIPLHSILPSVDQKEVFIKPPIGVRKIILSTNIAETSITIDDVVYVIDCGKIKLSNFDVKTNTQTLNPEWVSLANAKQRKGRAGRVQEGVCYHLYTKAREMVLEQFQLPEILRKRLEDVILTAKMLQLGKVESFFQCLIDCPDPEAISLSLDLLKRLNALDEDENLTPLGYHLAKLPMAPQIGKMILFGAVFSCLDPILSIAATLEFKDAFHMPLGRQQEVEKKKVELASGLKSDHLMFHQVLNRFQNCSDRKRFCWTHFLSWQTCKLLIDMKKQFMGYLYEMNFVLNTDPDCLECNRNSENNCLIKAIIASGLYPNVLVSQNLGKAPLLSLNQERFKIHPKSVLANERNFYSQLMVYYIKIKTQRDFIHDATLVFPLSIIFFGEDFEMNDNIITVNTNLRFKCTDLTGSVLRELRGRFFGFLEYKITHPGPIDWNKDGTDIKLLELMVKLITAEDNGDFRLYEMEEDF